jgi:hypothetical protein
MRNEIKRARQKFVAARIEARSRALARALDTLFNRIARREARLWAQRRTWFRKEFQPEEELELRNLITTFGLRRVDEAGADMAAVLGGTWDFTPTMKRDFLKKKEIKIREYVNDRNRELREKVRTVLVQAEAQDPPPTTGKLTEKLYLSLRDQGPFSLGRAERIARTETGQAENFGIFEGMKQSGVSKVEWVAHKGDLRTRPDHAEMHGVQVELGQHFVLPDGTKLLRPCDPDGPPHQIINCRCQLVPVEFNEEETAQSEEEPAPEAPPTLRLVPESQATEAPLLPDSPLRAPEPRAETATIDILGKEITFTLDHASIAESRSLVMIDVDELERAWRLDSGFHLPSESQGQSEILGRRERFREFLNENEKINASRVQIDPITNMISFSDGRHRFAVLRDLGVERLPVAVEPDDIALFIDRFNGRVIKARRRR